MKISRMVTLLALFGGAAFTSCKKNYTCTCTTVVSVVSTTLTHNIDNATLNAATNTCNSYRDEANKTLPGSTTCHL